MPNQPKSMKNLFSISLKKFSTTNEWWWLFLLSSLSAKTWRYDFNGSFYGSYVRSNQAKRLIWKGILLTFFLKPFCQAKSPIPDRAETPCLMYLNPSLDTTALPGTSCLAWICNGYQSDAQTSWNNLTHQSLESPLRHANFCQTAQSQDIKMQKICVKAWQIQQLNSIINKILLYFEFMSLNYAA